MKAGEVAQQNQTAPIIRLILLYSLPKTTPWHNKGQNAALITRKTRNHQRFLTNLSCLILNNFRSKASFNNVLFLNPPTPS